MMHYIMNDLIKLRDFQEKKKISKIRIGADSPVFHVLHAVCNRVRETRLIVPKGGQGE